MIISAHANSEWMLQSSRDLMSWVSMGNIRLPSSSMQVSVPVDASIDSAVFYRVGNAMEF
jgi:hypothetical protein